MRLLQLLCGCGAMVDAWVHPITMHSSAQHRNTHHDPAATSRRCALQVAIAGLPLAAATSAPLTAQAFGTSRPSLPLRACLVNAVQAREGARYLEADLREGKR